jgi:hypothetical protein
MNASMRAVLTALLVLAACAAGCKATQETGPTAAEQLARAQVVVLDDFNLSIPWKVETGQGGSADLGLNASSAVTRDRSMVITFAPGEKKKVVLSRRFEKLKDLSKCDVIALDVRRGPKTDCRLSLALHTLPGWRYAETPAVSLPPQEAPVVLFRLDGSHFKTERSGWKHTASLPNPKAVSKLTLVIHAERPGRIEVDNVRFARFAPAAEPGSRAEP